MVGNIIGNIIFLHPVGHVSCRCSEDLPERHWYRMTCLSMVHLQSNADRNVDLRGVSIVCPLTVLT